MYMCVCVCVENLPFLFHTLKSALSIQCFLYLVATAMMWLAVLFGGCPDIYEYCFQFFISVWPNVLRIKHIIVYRMVSLLPKVIMYADFARLLGFFLILSFAIYIFWNYPRGFKWIFNIFSQNQTVVLRLLLALSVCVCINPTIPKKWRSMVCFFFCYRITVWWIFTY